MSADMTTWEGRALAGAPRRRAVEQAAFERIPLKTRTRAGYVAAVFRVLTRKGYQVWQADYDPAGNCTECGEAGRCPGWHIAPNSLPTC